MVNEALALAKITEFAAAVERDPFDEKSKKELRFWETQLASNDWPPEDEHQPIETIEAHPDFAATDAAASS
ncbi:MAG: hypothetical protein WDN27_00190 [Candidatus Saccharibacteria bacterium]